MKKKLLSLMLVLLTLSSIVSTAAAANIPEQMKQLKAEISSLEQQISQVDDNVTYITGYVLSTSPNFIVEAKGINAETFFEKTPLYLIKNPQFGQRLLDMYWGWHTYEGKTMLADGRSVAVVGPAPERFMELQSQLDAKQKSFDTLVKQYGTPSPEGFKIDDCDANKTIRLQLNNPKFWAYGNWYWHEDGNMAACPVAVNGRTLIPIRSVIEAVGGTVIWNPSESSATVSFNSNTVVFKIGDTTAIVNGKPTLMDVPATVVNSKTMIPFRFACESVGLTDIRWNQDDQTVTIQHSLCWFDHEEQYLKCNTDGSYTCEDEFTSSIYTAPATWGKPLVFDAYDPLHLYFKPSAGDYEIHINPGNRIENFTGAEVEVKNHIKMGDQIKESKNITNDNHSYLYLFETVIFGKGYVSEAEGDLFWEGFAVNAEGAVVNIRVLGKVPEEMRQQLKNELIQLTNDMKMVDGVG